ncbi:hypothetical protein AX774_g1663 [Zancudomyces culisetae]|uniref:Uncharacterized protein n=1 Tax=Zancudomyces culisetae TaxID=1213189 RepID=A0A1R1PV00_ZANCU|nr:hypothetical protein AX774_g1663 [Zancudomyces culisetae]|eukprot:OMH84805.1 hypothetical protein AX774_g1663 [Zancudomyces culisetae]
MLIFAFIVSVSQFYQYFHFNPLIIFLPNLAKSPIYFRTYLLVKLAEFAKSCSTYFATSNSAIFRPSFCHFVSPIPFFAPPELLVRVHQFLDPLYFPPAPVPAVFYCSPVISIPLPIPLPGFHFQSAPSTHWINSTL